MFNELIEKVRALKAIKHSDVTLLVIDAVEGITDQDKKIGEISNDAGKGIIIAVNKWDLVENKHSTTVNEFTKDISSFASEGDNLIKIVPGIEFNVNILKVSLE